MKVAYCIREDYKTRGGGDAVQMLMTKKYLEKYFQDIEIDILTTPNQLNKQYDLCHIFNYSTFQETERYFNKALENKIKIASSPIYWDYNITAYQYFSKLKWFNINEKILTFEIRVLKLIQKVYPVFTLTSKNFANYCKGFMKNSNVILPNSIEEFKLLLKFINEEKSINYNFEVVYNATEKDEVKLSHNFFSKYKLPKDFLLQVGRIEPIKNQLNVVEALKNDNSIPIVFLGKVFDENYFNHVKKIADKRGNVFFIKEVPYEDVFDFYKNAHTHILPSLRESPGLVSLEAYSQGCNIICSNFPYSPFDTYFKDIAISIDPLDLDSIRKAINISYTKGKKVISDEILKIFSWDNTAKTTYKAYQSILKN